jgi:spermidine synthase
VPSISKSNKLLFYSRGFLSGFANLATEIIGPRLVASLFGSTTIIWAIIISVTLVGISVGYFFGGRVPYRLVPRVFPLVLIANAIWLVLLSWMIWKIPSGAASVGYVSIAVICILAFFPPSILFSMTSPMVISLIAGENPPETISRDVGNIYSLGTLGSVVGALLAAFVLIPYVGLSLSLKLFALGAVLYALVFLSPRMRLLGAAVLLAVIFFPLPSYKLEESDNAILLEQREGLYQTIRVFTDRTTYVQMNLGPTFQTSMSLQTGEPLYPYASKMVELAGDVHGKNILIIGGAGHSQARSLEKRGATVTEVEIDPFVVSLSDRYFGKVQGRVITTDGRAYLEGLQGETYDLILLDAYDALASVPVQLTTREFFEACDRALKPDGRLVFNFVGVPYGPNSNSFHAIAATMSSVFADTRASIPESDTLSNLILIGSQTPMDDSVFPPAPQTGTTLTDDLNPVEIYYEQARTDYYFR